MIVAFIGHRTIKENVALINRLRIELEKLIVDRNADIFLFGSKSQFDSLCYKVISELKEKYPHISRVYVRSAFEYIGEWYKDYLLEYYEDTYFPDSVHNSGHVSYIKRNQEMIDRCDLLVAYYDISYILATKNRRANSGTKLSIEYANKKKKEIINIFDNN